MTFITICQDLLSQDDCTQLIDHFKQDNRKKPGETVDGNLESQYDKISTDLYCNLLDPLDQSYNKLILPAVKTLIQQIKDEYQFLNYCGLWQITSDYNIQLYTDQQGYFTPHCEQGSSYPYRMMAWTIYLNNSPCGTEFPYQEMIVNATQGQGVIWPASWTHPHKGVTPNIGHKYIVTGWCEFFQPDIMPRLSEPWSDHALRTPPQQGS